MVSNNTDDNLSTCLVDRLNNLRLSKDLCDITLVVDGETFPVHKAVLAAQSTIFKNIFADLNNEKLHHPVIILREPDITASTFKNFIFSVYEKDINWDVRQALGVLHLAQYYNILSIVHKCSHFLRRSATPDNALIIGQAVCDHDDELWNFFAQYITDRPTEVLKSALLPQMSANFLAKIVNLNFNKLIESDIFNFLRPWFDAHDDVYDRQKIIKYIRFPFMNTSFLSNDVFHSKILNENQYSIALHAATSCNFEGQTEFSVIPRTHYDNWLVIDGYHILLHGDYRLCVAFEKYPQPRKQTWSVPCVFPKKKIYEDKFFKRHWFDTHVYASPCEEGTLFEARKDRPKNGVLFAHWRKIWF